MKSLVGGVFLVLCSFALADGPADNVPDKVRRIPPPGITVPSEMRAELEAGVKQLGNGIAALRAELTRTAATFDQSQRARLLPDVEIFHKAVDWALRYDEFLQTNQLNAARGLLQEGERRLGALRSGRSPWLETTGAVARGYVSRIDGSIQPYGLVLPAGAGRDGRKPLRLDIWFHGRGETLSEVDFVNQRNNPKNLGEFAPSNAIVLHPYGRYCNGSRFAGETDVFEAMEALDDDFAIDARRITVRGFSLGGASVWHFAAHYPARWAAAAPGAGFSETADFLKVFQNEKLTPPWWEQKLWRLHDAPDWIENFRYLPTVAYSGEVDRQKQAADVMAKAYEKAGLKLPHIIGPQTAHKYHPDAKRQINEFVDEAVAKGREVRPKQISFVTYTTRYNQMAWGTVDGLEQHWEPAYVQGELADDKLVLRTTNVSALTLRNRTQALIDGQLVGLPREQLSKRALPPLTAVKHAGQWTYGSIVVDGLRKQHGLQGPIDDAFMDSFLVVRPTGRAANEKAGTWAARELAHMTNHWRQHYRGDARVKDDTAVTRDDMATHHLVLFGDPASNVLLARLAAQLPIRWTQGNIALGSTNFAATNHALICIYPNPLAPHRYVVLNSGFTFREYDYLNNARQTPKLPDYAIVNLDSPVTSRGPGGIAAAGFFGERWELRMEGGGSAAR